MQQDVVVTTEGGWLTITINGLTHLRIEQGQIVGYQSWLDGWFKRRYYVEYYLKDGKPILTEYAERGLWKQILKQLITKQIKP